MPRADNLGSAQICLTDLTAGTAAACRTIDLSPATGTGVAVKDTAGRIELDALALLQ